MKSEREKKLAALVKEIKALLQPKEFVYIEGGTK